MGIPLHRHSHSYQTKGASTFWPTGTDATKISGAKRRRHPAIFIGALDACNEPCSRRFSAVVHQTLASPEATR
jgi:hypothetical protein